MAIFCPNCGTSLPEDKKFCTECGAALNTTIAADTPPASVPKTPPAQQRPIRAAASPPPQRPAQSYYNDDTPPSMGSKYEPISTKGYIGIMLLMCIPIVGVVLAIIWACGGCKKINKRNLARASLIMMAVALIISLVLGFAIKSLVNTVIDTIEDQIGIENIDNEERNGLGGLLGGLIGADGNTNSDIQELEELQQLLNDLEGVTGENNQELDDLIDGVQQANRDAEAINDGWPSSLRAYPGGTATAIASYRTQISGTTQEEMMAWIADLKKDGFVYQDFYDFGMTEADMLEMNGWWAYDGKTYLSVSYLDGVVTVDHTKELPDLESYFN